MELYGENNPEDYIRVGSDKEVIQLWTHNAPLTLGLLFASKTRD